MQWTEIFILLPEIKKIFPDAKYIGIEEDVTFLRYERLYESEKNIFLKAIKKHKYVYLRKIETNVCNLADRVILNNQKDCNLLKEQNVDPKRLYVWQPYFDLMLDRKYIGDSNNIIFMALWGGKKTGKAQFGLSKMCFQRYRTKI